MRGVWHVCTVGQAGIPHGVRFAAQCVGFAVVGKQGRSYASAMLDQDHETALAVKTDPETKPLCYTGDCLGAVQQLFELGIYFGVALWL